MKTLDDLRAFYATSLVPVLKALDVQRQKIIAIVLTWTYGVGAIFLALALLTRNSGLLIFLPFAFLVTYSLALFLNSREFVSAFKTRVIGEIVRFIDPGLSYNPAECIPQGTYLASDIFKTSPDRYHGDDHTTGKIGSTQVEFSELHSEYKTTDSKGRTHWHTIFKGIFFIGDLNKEYRGRTVVLPDVAEKMFGFLGTGLQAMNKTRGQLIKLEDPEFEKEFVVYGDDQIQSRYVLTTSLMKRILDFKKKSKKDIYLSFINGKIFIAISQPKNLFEPNFLKTLVNFTIIQEYFENFMLILGMVDDLNLNMRIWGKA